MITFHKTDILCDLSPASFEDAVLKLTTLSGEPVPAVLLITSRLIQFSAARLVRFFDEEFKSKNFLNTGFLAPVIFLSMNPMWIGREWLVLSDHFAVGSEGV